MPFADFHGNPKVVQRLRSMLGRGRFPHGVILAGPEGSGKYTLAQMLAKAMNCLNSPPAGNDEQPGLGLGMEAPPAAGLPDFCGVCKNCVRIAEADDLAARCSEGVETRDSLRDADKKETRIFVQTHPDVLVIPPDPPQMMIKVDQVRHVTATIYYRPGEARRRVYIFTSSAFMKEAANALLKVLEEPPEFATLFLLAENAGALLPTIRSRCVTFSLAPLEQEEIERLLAARRPDWTPKQRSLVAALSGGAAGRALTFDLPVYLEARKDALTLLSTALHPQDHSDLFRATETYRAGAEGKEKTDRLLRTTAGLLRDLVAIQSGTPELVRNRDLQSELAALARSADFRWITQAMRRLDEVESGMRRNLLRNLSLDSFVAALEQ